MMHRRPVLLCLILLSWDLPAQAYLDPVTTSFVLQGLIGAVMAVVASFRSIRQKLFAMVLPRPRKRKENSQERPAD
jgi:hypothetical protein